MTSAARIRLRISVLLVGAASTIATARLVSADAPPGYHAAAQAIKGARIVAGPDATIEAGTVVVRDGRIEAVGPEAKVAIPYDAETIDGKGLIVYPGFIDLYTTVGQNPAVVRSRTGAGRTVDFNDRPLAATPLDNRNGLTPEFEVASALEFTESMASDRRKLGFTDLLSAPAGAIATGQSVLFSTSGAPRREAIVRSPVALHINLRAPFEPAASRFDDDHAAPRIRVRTMGRYPSVLMGAVAHLRQAMLDAEYQHELMTAKAGEKGAARLAVDPALQAFYQARTRALPVWWEANTRDEIHRVLDLAEEFGTTAVVVGGREAAKAAEQLPSQLRKLIAAGLTREAALDALTRRAAEIAGTGSMLGTIEPGKLGHLVVMSAPLGDENAKVKYVLVDGQKYEIDPAGSGRSKSESESRSSSTTSGSSPGRGDARPDAARTKADESKSRESSAPKVESPPAARAKASTPAQTPPTTASPPRTIEDQPPVTPFLDVAIELDETRKPRLKTGGNVLIKDATILTVAKDGTIPRGSILVEKGKIAAVGTDLKAPAGVTVIEAAGMVVMPGIIDSHSHIAIQGSGNEWSLSVVPEVRIKDVITGDDPAIFRALAGGTTTARILHGSADTIGGQDAVIKLRYGQAGRDLIVTGGPQGVKFALGENVTRNPGRFPNTRMGVEATIERAFEEARAYQDRWQAYHAARAAVGPPPTPPRRDLRLEALAKVLDGSIKVHCHCYRSDEILMLLGVAARHGVKIQSLQHVLEGYKVAPEIAAHGASASTFSDWWAYKIEAYDAIPYNAALMTQAGVPVCIKSDSEELIRHLNLEAAKMVKYGGVTEAQALAMITINPARELGLQQRIGSIEVGKDADLAFFNAHPFDAFARCDLALIDGEVWFQRQAKEAKLVARPGDHAAMPAPAGNVKAMRLDIPRSTKGVYALVGATLHPVEGADIAGGTLIISDGKIAAMGGADTRVPDSAQTVDLQGFDVWPGLVDAGTRLGLYEVNSLAETQDNADSAAIEPELRTGTALHPDSEIIPVARANGILTAYVQPDGGLISGQGCVIDLAGWVPREMIVADPVALHVVIPAHIPADPFDEPPPRREGPDPRQKRAEQIESIKEAFRRSLAYDKVVTEARARQALPPVPDPRMAALVPYAKGQKPVFIHADHRTEILDALKIAEELKLKVVLTGAADAWKVADAIKAAKVPVLVGGTLHLPIETTDPYDAPYCNPARLHEAGVTFAIRSIPQGPQQATASRNLPYEAAMAVAFGLPEADAIKAVTIAPARILGISDQVGSLEVGKRANLVITAGHLLQPTTEVKAIFLNGKPTDPRSRHTRLYEKYRQRLAEVRAGTAALGIDVAPAAAARPAAPAAGATAGPAGHD